MCLARAVEEFVIKHGFDKAWNIPAAEVKGLDVEMELRGLICDQPTRERGVALYSEWEAVRQPPSKGAYSDSTGRSSLGGGRQGPKS